MAKIKKMVDAFAALMLIRFREKHAQGYTGWDRRAPSSLELLQRLIGAALRGKWVDVANMAAILHAREYQPAPHVALNLQIKTGVER